MTLFACAVRLDGRAAPEPTTTGAVARYVSDRRLTCFTACGFRAMVGVRAGDAVSPGIVRVGGAVGVGVARLDDRDEVRRRLGVARGRAADGEGESTGDLALVVRHLAAGLPPERLAGDFAVVVWDATARRLVAARDALGVRRLYWTAPRLEGTFAFASHAGLLASGDDAYDLRYLVEWISARAPSPERTAYAGVRALPGGSVLTLRGGAPTVAAFWSPREVQAAGAPRGSEREQCDDFGALLADGVRARLDDGVDSWAHLSGGLDSSSVVSVAQWLAERGRIPRGLAGTVTYVDDHRTAADERVYSDAVVRRYGVRNVAVAHQPGWRDVALDPPELDQPSSRSYFVVARDREVVRAVRGAGGRVLLTGIGGDHLALGTMFFFADWVARGEWGRAGREMLRRAALGRVSFWRLAYENALLPLLPAAMRRALLGAEGRSGVPPWVTRGLARRVGLTRGDVEDDADYGGRWGSKYADALAAGVAAIPSQLSCGVIEDALDMRHPFLHRPLVEYALRLPPELCVRPHARKWVLREAMRGVLPEFVRTRIGKGSGTGLMVWSLAHERGWVEALLRDPLLAQLGCIEPATLREAIARAGARTRGDPDDDPALLAVRTLEVEMWLRVRAGRWVAASGSRAGVSRTSHEATAGR